MRFSVSSREFLRTLNALSKVIVKKNAIPILGHVLMYADGEKYYAVGSSAENTLYIPLSLTMLEKGKFTSFCFPFDKVISILSSIDDQPIEFQLSSSFLLTVRHSAGDFSVQASDGSLFPLTPEDREQKFSFHVPSSFLIPTVKQASLCVGDDLLRPILMGVCFDVKPDGLTIASSNGRMLYKRDFNHGCPFVEGETPKNFVIPRTALSAFEAAFSKTDMLRVSFDGLNAVVSADDILLRMRTVEGKYPNYEKIIPSERRCHITTSLADLKSAVKRVSIFSGDSRMLKLCNENGHLLLKAENVDFSDAASEAIASDDCNLDAGFKICLRSDYLTNLLMNVSTQNVRILLLSSERPIIIMEDDPKSPLLEMMMPMLN